MSLSGWIAIFRMLGHSGGGIWNYAHIFPPRFYQRVRLNWIITPNWATLQCALFKWLPSAIVNSFEGPTQAEQQHRWLLPVSICICCRAAIIMACAKPQHQKMSGWWTTASIDGLIIRIYDVWLCKTVESVMPHQPKQQALSYCSTFGGSEHFSHLAPVSTPRFWIRNHSDGGWFSKSFAITFNHSPNKARRGSSYFFFLVFFPESRYVPKKAFNQQIPTCWDCDEFLAFAHACSCTWMASG